MQHLGGVFSFSSLESLTMASTHQPSTKKFSLAQHLPIEVILAFGEYLKGKALVASLRVCRHWYQILHSFLWRCISKTCWHHGRFPLNRLLLSSRMEGSAHPLFLELQNVRYMEWYANHALSGYITDVDLKKFQLRKQLPMAVLCQVLRMVPNLTWLSLRNYEYTPLKVGPLFDAVKQLHSLKSLSIAIWSTSTNVVPLKNLYPVFGRLEHLLVRGTWCQADEDLQKMHDKQYPPSPDLEPWLAMRTLRVRRELLPLVYRCKNLRELEIVHSWSAFYNSMSTSLLPLVACPRLEKVRLCPQLDGRFKDVGKALSTLKELKELALSVYSMDDIEFLRAPSRHQEHQEQEQGQEQDSGWRCDSPSTSSPSSFGDLSVSLLEHLEIQSVSLGGGSQERTWISELAHHILKTRHRLKYFSLQKFPLCIQDDLVIQGFEEEGMVWACKELETLQLALKTHDDLGPGLFSALFREIGQMKRLKKLIIRYTTRRVEGRLEILDAFQQDGGKELRELTLANTVHYQRWSREEIVKLTTSMPKLRYLNLKPLDRNQYQVIASWLCELGRGEIRLVT
ncbi:MAG: hypothetical protein J3Q66DRAFT_327444 [Benniella sp.]|nr:MAG: hypothetical protein J3Q66DRAFT_327444 [Benniella sp.]